MRPKPVSGARGLALTLAGLILLLGLLPATLSVLDWDRAAIQDGQWYRIFTAHLVHLGLKHLLLNLVALLLLAELFWHELPPRKAAGLLLASALGVGLGLFLAAPDLSRYAGLSGVLHGAWAGSALLLLQKDDRGETARVWWALALLVLAGKLAMENFSGASLMEPGIGIPVILQSHALGALSGLAFAGLAWMTKPVRGVPPAVASVPLFD